MNNRLRFTLFKKKTTWLICSLGDERDEAKDELGTRKTYVMSEMKDERAFFYARNPYGYAIEPHSLDHLCH